VSYADFIRNKSQIGGNAGFDPVWMPDWLFGFQQLLTEWSCRKARSAIFADCGLGKTPMQLVWAENVARKTDRPVLILTPLAVSYQTEREAQKFDIEAAQCRDGNHKGRIVIANYEILHKFSPDDFAGLVCDESSILKAYSGITRKRITRFISKMEYRLLCTATAAPNDYVELGTSSEALGELSHSEMLRRFFRYLDDKGQRSELRHQEEAERLIARDPSYYRKLAYRVAQTIGQWRLKHHAIQHFWRWVASWARACRMPSDLGFSDDGFILPDLIERDHIIKPSTPPPGMLFTLPAFGIGEEREERRRTLGERVEFVADLVNHNEPAIVWCHLNEEGDALESAIPGSAQISGKTPDERKIELYEEFTSGRLRVLVTKPKIGGWGLNWQHCNHVVTFATHSYEQFYQSVRRCYRFGQQRPVRLDVVATEGEARVIENMKRKADRASLMFDALVKEMRDATCIARDDTYTDKIEVPHWAGKLKRLQTPMPSIAVIASRSWDRCLKVASGLPFTRRRSQGCTSIHQTIGTCPTASTMTSSFSTSVSALTRLPA
jgi:superfamily II DNA or RNA helicase